MFYPYQLPLIYAYIFVPVISTKEFFLVQNNIVDEITSHFNFQARANPKFSLFSSVSCSVGTHALPTVFRGKGNP